MILDTNTWVGHWAFQPLHITDPVALAHHLETEGIDQAWTAAADAVLYPDPQLGNEQWLPQIAGIDCLTSVAVINPVLANWRDSLEKCANLWRAGVMKLVPGYHQLTLSDEPVDACVKAAAEMGLIVSIQMRMEDERRHHPLMKVPPPVAQDVAALAVRHPDMLFHIACAYWGEAMQLADVPNVILELSSIEMFDTLAALLAHLPPERICFGSHTPFYFTHAALNKLRMSTVDPKTVAQVASGTPALRKPEES